MGEDERFLDEADLHLMEEGIGASVDRLVEAIGKYINLGSQCVGHMSPETPGKRQLWERLSRNQRRVRESIADLSGRFALAKMMPVVFGQFARNVAVLASGDLDIILHTEHERLPGRCVLVTYHPMGRDGPGVNPDGSMSRYEGVVATYEIGMSPFMIIDPKRVKMRTGGIASSIELIKETPTREIFGRRAFRDAKRHYRFILGNTSGDDGVALASFHNVYQLGEDDLSGMVLSKYERRFGKENADYLPEAAGQAFEDVMGRLSGWKNTRRAGLYVATVPLGPFERARYFPMDDAPQQYRDFADVLLSGSGSRR